MILLAVSGGPDSMFMLNEYKNKKIVVACVNYNIRFDSVNDENIVRDFCAKHNIQLEVLSLDKNEKPESGNFQNWARDKRYNFFKEIYDKYNCSKVLFAHHKDDFIETALMQQRANRNVEYFGIRKKNEIFGMKIERPFLHKFWKREILRELDEEGIKFAIDSSNDQPIYERNKIRIELNELSFSEKKDMYEWFILSNKILVKKSKKVNALYKYWEKEKFNTHFFDKQNFKSELVYKYVNTHFSNVKLSEDKIDSIIQFIEGKEGNKEYILNDSCSIYKKNSMITPKFSNT